MRCTQFYGLSKSAKAFLDGLGTRLAYTDHIKRVFPDGRTETFESEHRECNFERKDSDRVVGMFDDVTLVDYILYDGRALEERVQREIWSSGPMIFTALWDPRKETWVDETLWEQSEIDDY